LAARLAAASIFHHFSPFLSSQQGLECLSTKRRLSDMAYRRLNDAKGRKPVIRLCPRLGGGHPGGNQEMSDLFGFGTSSFSLQGTKVFGSFFQKRTAFFFPDWLT